jgi:hypothetical protein
MATFAEFLNTVMADSALVGRIPEATSDNIEAVGNAIMAYSATRNEFLSLLVNKIAMTIINNRRFKNPLAFLKSGTLPAGNDIEELFANPAIASAYDPTGAGLLTVVAPDVKSIFHRLNRQDKYAVNITKTQLKRALTSYAGMNDLVNLIVQTLYNGDEIDEFTLMKNTFGLAIAAGKISAVTVDDPTDATKMSALLSAMHKTSKFMTFPSSKFNTYYANRPPLATDAAVTTWTPLEEQCIMIRADIEVDMSLNVLASVFNMEMAQLKAQMVSVDNFGSATDTLALVCDRNMVRVYDTEYEADEFFNPDNLSHKMYLHHHQVLSLSLFANAVAFNKPAATGG